MSSSFLSFVAIVFAIIILENESGTLVSGCAQIKLKSQFLPNIQKNHNNGMRRRRFQTSSQGTILGEMEFQIDKVGPASPPISITQSSSSSSSSSLPPSSLSSSTNATGRGIFLGGEGLWMYHLEVDSVEGIGCWIVGHHLSLSPFDDNLEVRREEEKVEGRESDFPFSVLGYVESWAVSPHMIGETSDRAVWKFRTFQDGEWIWKEDPLATVLCTSLEGDTSVFLCSSTNIELCEYFFPTSPFPNIQIYRSVEGLNFYHLPEGRWMVSHDDPGSTSGIAFIDCPLAAYPHEIPFVCHPPQPGWQVFWRRDWKEEKGFLVVGQEEGVSNSVSGRLRSLGQQREKERTVEKALDHHGRGFQERAEWTVLKSGMGFPLLSLGTGGLDSREVAEVVREAIKDIGYVSIDSASAYQNEEILGEMLLREEWGWKGKGGEWGRSNILMTSKVWPTQLGYRNTLISFEESLKKLRTGYLDLYLLHWPFCYKEISWMDCPEEPSGTWQQSWRALERLYAEGKALSIGISNFDYPLLEQSLKVAQTTPSVLQNWMDPLQVDDGILQLCKENEIHFQAYSVLRRVFDEFDDNPKMKKIREIISRVAHESRRDAGEVGLKWAMNYGEIAGVKIGTLCRSRNMIRLKLNFGAAQMAGWVGDEGQWVNEINEMRKGRDTPIRLHQEL